ncbi:LacI family DNA-binding transcriptional regulator [Mesorhizobium sp. B2-4-6]|uniref:LacI family DNA-binding transcriptional regulator n=1 Tax=Mesorhizobium sp. B2-4-6 TaxID=2589943 RepID=UPI0015E280A3|nr:LacI family DNA-binding transcriptional regulator [Mesorhizobium sp. B2-4-6]
MALIDDQGPISKRKSSSPFTLAEWDEITLWLPPIGAGCGANGPTSVVSPVSVRTMQKRFFKESSGSTGCQEPVTSTAMSGIKRTTIRDVAAAAGVSVTTVSDALSGKGRLPEETRKKVQAAAEKLSYRPSAIALGLRERGLGLVGLCIAPAGEAMLTDVGYWATIVTRISQTVLSEGLAPVLLPHNVDMLARLKIPLDGAIVIDPLEGDSVLTFFEKKRIRYVTIGRDLRRDNRSWLDDDNADGVSRLLEQTVAPGTAVAFVTIGPKKSYVVDALDGAKQWACSKGSSVEAYHCENIDSHNVEAALGLALERGATAIIAQHDRLALRLLAALKARGIQVPKDVRLLSVVDTPELEQASPSITAVRQHPRQLADMTAHALIDLIRGKSELQATFLPMEIMIRESAPIRIG